MKCDLPICTRDALAWCCVDGEPRRLCAPHMHGATRGGCWVEVDWHAPLDGAAPRFEGRPCSSEPVHTVEVMPPPRRERTKRPTPELASPARAEGICRNRWCTHGRGGVPRTAIKRGLCDDCYSIARDRKVLDVVALPALDRTDLGSYRRPRSALVLVLREDADAHPDLCRNAACAKPPSPEFRGLCWTCRQAAVSRGLVQALSLPRRFPGPPKGQSIPRPVLESA